MAIYVRECEQVLDSADWCSHIDAEALGIITVFVRPRSALQLRSTGLSEVVHEALISLSITVMDIPAIVNIWFVATTMENNTVMIIRWGKFINGINLLDLND